MVIGVPGGFLAWDYVVPPFFPVSFVLLCVCVFLRGGGGDQSSGEISGPTWDVGPASQSRFPVSSPGSGAYAGCGERRHVRTGDAELAGQVVLVRLERFFWRRVKKRREVRRNNGVGCFFLWGGGVWKGQCSVFSVGAPYRTIYSATR